MIRPAYYCRFLQSLVITMVSLAVAMTLALGGAEAKAQYQITAGASDLAGVNGVTLSKYDGARVSMLSLGQANGSFVLGAATEVHGADGTLRYGDTMTGFALPTDLGSAGREVGARGVQWTHICSKESFRIFAGKTGNTLQYGYLNVLNAERWYASAEWARALTPKITLSGLAAFSAAHAALLSMNYRATLHSEYAVTAGWNAGHPVFAVSAKMHGQGWLVAASETLGRLQLRPQTNAPQADDPYQVPEREGLNFNIEKKLWRWLQTDVSRVAYGSTGGLPEGARMYSAGITATEGRFSEGMRVFSSHDEPQRAEGIALLARYTKSYWSLDVSLLESHLQTTGEPAVGRTQAIVVSATRRINVRVKLTGGFNVADSAPTLLAGGEVAGSWGSLSVAETMVYVPFGINAGFSRVMQISLRTHPHDLLEASTNFLLSRNKPWSYAAVASGVIEQHGERSDKMRFRAGVASMPKYVLRGVVVDEIGAPVASAAVQVGDQVVYTDEQGVWMCRQRKPDALPVGVMPERFLTQKAYRAREQAPQQSVPVLDSNTQSIVLHVAEQPMSKELMLARTQALESTLGDEFAEAPAANFAAGRGWFKKVLALVVRGDFSRKERVSHERS